MQSHRRPIRVLRDTALALADAILPQTCVVCGLWIPAGSGADCANCRASIQAARELPYCPRCARGMSPLSIHPEGCARCEHESFWNVARVVRVGPYRDALQRAVVGLKFVGQERRAAYLGGLLCDCLLRQPWSPDVDVLVPVPMHPLRRAQRPCNHAAVLAEALAERINRAAPRRRVKVREAAVRRVQYAPSQTRTSSRHERFDNVKGCFGPARKPNVAGRTVCIVDNLLVTGATIHEVSKVLRAAGAKRIYAAVVARSVMPGDFQAAALSGGGD